MARAVARFALLLMSLGFSATLFNPLSLVSPQRLVDIEQAVRFSDVIVLPGTRLRQRDGPYWYDGDKQRWRLHFGYGKPGTGAMTTRAAGITFSFDGRRIDRTMVTRIDSPPDKLAGRLAAVRLKAARTDLTLVACYFPPSAGSWRASSSGSRL